jgi:DNA-binding NarL/FixJ family response regulator
VHPADFYREIHRKPYADDETILEALQAGALGYLTKDAGREDIRHALLAAANGQAVMDPLAQQRLIAAAARAPRPGAPKNRADLTAREVEVLTLLAEGRDNRAIARELFISETTVKTHINHLFAKTHSADRATAVRYAYDHGFTRPSG